VDSVKTQEKSLGELLRQAGKVTQDQIHQALSEQKRTHEPFGKILVRLGFVRERDILQVLEGLTALTFETGGECFGIETYRVREVVPYAPIRAIPLAGAEIPGLTSLRGEFLPVFSFRALLGLPPAASPEATWFIVMALPERPCVLWIDSLREVIRFPMEQVEPMPAFLYGKRSEFFYCLGKMKGRLFSMINPDRLARDERLQAALEEKAHASQA